MNLQRLLQSFRRPVPFRADEEKRTPVPYRWAPVVFLGLVVAILVITWPWATTLSSEFLEHWDPPFHAWKLQSMARSILDGHLLPVDGNSNMLYPHSGALYHEALQWPQALVAAPFFALPHANPILIYHGVLLSFWALSGVCLWMLLLAVGTTQRAALLGAAFFTLMPYSVSYMVEFNMKLNFGLPLFFFFGVRYFQRPSIRYACGLAVAWWLQATSELYQAIFLILLLPLMGIPLLVVHFRLLGSWRKFWLPVLCAGALGGVLSGAILLPYLSMLNAETIHRLLREVQLHSLKPLSYFCSLGRFRFGSAPPYWFDEMVVYPTVAMLVLTGLYGLQTLAARGWTKCGGLGGGLRTARNLFLLLFALLTFGIYWSGGAAWIAPVYSALPVLASLTVLAALCFPARRDLASLFLSGLFAVAVIAFFMSLGPRLVLYCGTSIFTASNPLYLWLYRHVGALQGFRVVSRFSIFPLMFMCVASAWAWSQLEKRHLHPRWLRELWILPVVLLALEAVPGHIHTRPFEVNYTSPVLETLDRMEQPYVLAVVPLLDRYFTARHMLQIGRDDRRFVYGWGGAFPKFSKEIAKALHPDTQNPAGAALLLRQMWPECLVLEDKSLSRGAETNLTCNYAQWLAEETERIAEDDRFVLLRFRSRPTATVEEIRQIRADVLRANPWVHFRARLEPGEPETELYLDVNGHLTGSVTLTAAAQDFVLAVPRDRVITLLPNRLRFHAAGDQPFRLESFSAGPGSEVESSDFCIRTASPPWLHHVHRLPPGAHRIDVAYGPDFQIVACEIPQTTVAPGSRLAVRYFVRCRLPIKAMLQRVIVTRLYPAAGRWVEEGYPVSKTIVDMYDYLSQRQWDNPATPRLYIVEMTVYIPPDLAPGDYTPFAMAKTISGTRLKGVVNGQKGKKWPLPFTIHVRPGNSGVGDPP